ncbi:hypothetical protein D3C87_2024880 [compost metagenome]
MNMQVDVHIAADILDKSIVNLLLVIAYFVENQQNAQRCFNIHAVDKITFPAN